MKTLSEKLKSRKFWMAVLGVVTGLSVIFGLDETTISTVSGAALSVVSAITYIVVEGKIDTAAVSASTSDDKETENAT